MDKVAAPAADFSEFLWMGEEDVEAFERGVEEELVEDEIMWCELEEMLDEEEESGSVYFVAPGADLQNSSDDDDFGGLDTAVVGVDCWLAPLNPEAPSFVPVSA